MINKSKYRLLALDLDGTLTNHQKQVSDKNKLYIRRAQEAGVDIILASGRPVIGIENVARALDLYHTGGYILAYNGGQIIDCKTGKSLVERFIPMSYYHDICDVIHHFRAFPLTYNDVGVICENDEDMYVKKEGYNNSVPVIKVPSLEAEVKKPVVKCTGAELTAETLYHIGLPVEDIPELVKECRTTPCMMPYVTTFFMPRAEGDRPNVVPDGAKNFAFVGEFVETPRDTVFTTEIAIRTGMEAVYTLANLDRAVPECWGSPYDVREMLRATSYLMDHKKTLEFLMPKAAPVMEKAGKVCGTVAAPVVKACKTFLPKAANQVVKTSVFKENVVFDLLKLNGLI